MNFRELIARAMQEARDEYDAIIQRKLAALMGDSSSPTPPSAPRKKSEPVAAKAPKAPKAAAAVAAKPAAKPAAKAAASKKRYRATENEMTDVRARVLGAFKTGEPLKKGEVMKRTSLGGDDVLRVGLILRRLKEEGRLAMAGEKGAATYTLLATPAPAAPAAAAPAVTPAS